jgi:hypothetical protein
MNNVVASADEKSKYIAVKTLEVEYNDDLLLLGECLFAVEREEWLSFRQFLTKETLVETFDNGNNSIDVYQLYHEAETFEVDENIIMFLLVNGMNDPLNYIRRGIIFPKNKLNLYNIFNKLALFREIEKLKNDDLIDDELVIDAVSISKTGYYEIEKDPTVLSWKLPSSEGEIESCKEINQKLMEEALSTNRYSLTSILYAKNFWCDLGYNNKRIYFKLTIPDDVCLWNPDVIIELKHNNNYHNYDNNSIPDHYWKIPPIRNSRKINVYYFLQTFLPSLTDENYQEHLEQFFSL